MLQLSEAEFGGALLGSFFCSKSLLFRFHPVAAATGFHHERHAELDGIFHGVHYKVSCGVQRFCGHFEDEFVMYLQEQAGRNPLAQKQRL